MIASFLLLLVAATASAAECDVRSLTRALRDATPTHTGARFAELAACDAEAARAEAERAVPRFLAGSNTNEGVLAAITVGAGDRVSAWLGGLQRNELGPTIDWLGGQCTENPEVADFFVTAQQEQTERFWSERWYRGLADCRVPGIQDLLTKALEARRDDPDRTRFFALVGLYARNLGADALPTLEALLPEIQESQRRLLIEAWADAADVGSVDGMDEAAADAAVTSLARVREHVPPSGSDILRLTLLSLGDREGSEGSVALRWPERLQDGAYRYVAAAHETWTCRNGKSFATFHLGEIRDAATVWPDTLAEALPARLTDAWKLGRAASRCKGEAEVEVRVTDEPLPPGDNAQDWLEEARAELDARAGEVRKVSEEEHDPLDFQG